MNTSVSQGKRLQMKQSVTQYSIECHAFRQNIALEYIHPAGPQFAPNDGDKAFPSVKVLFVPLPSSNF